MKRIITLLSYFWSFVYTISIRNRVHDAQRVFYTGYFKRFFKLFGKNSFIEYKASSLVGLKYISVGNDTWLNTGIRLTAWDSYYGQKFTPQICIGNNCNIGSGSHITACNNVYIGNNVLTGPNVLISDNSHGMADEADVDVPPVKRLLYSKGAVVIEDNVWLGQGVCVLPGVRIGHNAIIGANSVVTRDIEPYCIAAGNPAKIIRNLKEVKEK